MSANNTLSNKLLPEPAPLAAPVKEPLLKDKLLSQPIDSNLPPLPNVVKSPKQLDEFSTKTSQGLDSESQSWIKSKTDALKALNEEAKKIYQEDKSRVDMAKVGEMIGHALTQIGYGLAGLKSQTYGGNLQFNKADWESKYSSILDEYKTTLAQGRGEIEAEADSFQARDSERQRLGRERDSRAERMYWDEKNERDRKAREKEKPKKSPKLEDTKKILKDFDDIEGLKEKYYVTKGKAQRAEILKQINTKIGKAEDDETSIKDIQKLLDDSKDSALGKISKFFGGEGDKDIFTPYILKEQKRRLDEVRGRNKARLEGAGLTEADLPPEPEAESAPAESLNQTAGYVRMKKPDGKVIDVPAAQVENAKKLGAVEVK